MFGEISTLDIAEEGGDNKFQTAENVWNSKVTGYDLSAAGAGSVNSEDTVISGLQKLESQLDSGVGSVSVTTSMLPEKSISHSKHFAKPGTTSGFLKLGGANPKSWGLQMNIDLQFKGETAVADISTLEFSLAGDYYVLSDSGEDNGIDYNKGDWLIYNGTDPTPIKIDNSGKVLEFNGRKGVIVSCPDAVNCVDKYDYSWKMLNLANSKLEEIADVTAPDSTGLDNPNNGVYKILKRDTSDNWVLEVDEAGVANNQSVSGASIADDQIMDIHVGNYIQINQIQSLEDNLNGLLNYTGGDVSGSINLGGHKLQGISMLGGKDFGQLIQYASDPSATLLALEPSLPLSTNPSDIIVVSPNSSTKSALSIKYNKRN